MQLCNSYATTHSLFCSNLRFTCDNPSSLGVNDFGGEEGGICGREKEMKRGRVFTHVKTRSVSTTTTRTTKNKIWRRRRREINWYQFKSGEFSSLLFDFTSIMHFWFNAIESRSWFRKLDGEFVTLVVVLPHSPLHGVDLEYGEENARSWRDKDYTESTRRWHQRFKIVFFNLIQLDRVLHFSRFCIWLGWLIQVN